MSSNGIPTGWTVVAIKDVADILAGYGFPEILQGRASGEIPFYKVGDISEAWKRKETMLSAANHYVSAHEAKELQATPLPSGTTVFAKIGAAIALNRRALLGIPSLVDNNVMGLSPCAGMVEPKFLFYFVCTLRLNDLARSTTVPSIRKSDVAQIPFPLPPFREQQRIAQDIERLLTDLDAAVAALKRVNANLKRYRTSVLKAACEGRLVPTEAELARKHCRTYETGEQLLARILKERRAKWETDQLAKKLAAGKPPENDDWKKKYKEPAPPNTTSLPPLAEGWTWTTAGYLFECIVPNRDKPRSFTGTTPWITLPDFDDSIELTASKSSLGLTQDEVDKYHARVVPKGSVVMSCVGRFGITAVAGVPLVINQQLHAFVIPAFLPGRYYAYALGTQVRYMEKLSTATTISYLNKDNCNSVPIPLAPLIEQERIVQGLDARLSVAAQIQQQISASLARADRLRQGILKRAFEGNLVSQDPNDEPASVLLERIRAERAANANSSPKTDRKHKIRPASAAEAKF